MSRIELRGFKSFGNTKVVLPLSKGLTAFIGPNGVGKSNVVDALCFVLGEMSKKTMRAERFSDLIFNGGNGQRPSTFAEVSLHFDNSDGAIPIESKVVTISRRVDRSGKCVFWINKKRASRQEIVDLLAPSMSSPGGYNFVMQGEIDRLIEMDAVERRRIIDDLAGVAEFDEKKQHSLVELQRVESNLASINAVLGVLSDRLEKLRSDRENVIRHKELTLELKNAQASLLHLTRAKIRRELSLLQREMETKERRIRQLQNRQQKILDEVARSEQKMAHLDRLMEEKQSVSSFAELITLKGRLGLLDEMFRSKSEELKRVEDELAKKSIPIEKIEPLKTPLEEVGPLFSKFEGLYAEFTRLARTIKPNQQRDDFLGSIRELMGILGDLKSVLEALYEKLKASLQFLEGMKAGGKLRESEGEPQLCFRLLELRAAHTELKDELEQIDRQMQECRARLERVEEIEKRERAALQGIRERKENLRRKVSCLRNRADQRREVIERLKDELVSLKTREAVLRSRLEGIEMDIKQVGVLVEVMEGMDPKELERRIEGIRAELQALGDVNFTAIEEFRDAEQKYNSEKSKYDKLVAEKQAILDFMKEVDEKKKGAFMSTFNEISKHFEEIFSELSPGGTARLVLENEENPFEGGLEIEARPAGKNLSRVEAHGGGERAMTAVAFIFALQRFRPSTFYVLDEIDAHLDPQNLDRVAKLVQRYSRESQVILVTHRDPMMTVADRVFGITMDKNHVSHAFSVGLEGLA